LKDKQIKINPLIQKLIRLNHKASGVYELRYQDVFEWVLSRLEYDEKDLKGIERAGCLVPHGIHR